MASMFLVDAVTTMNMTNILQLVASTAVLYDHVITFDQEVDLVWKRKWTISKILFFTIRYIGDALMICQTCLLTLQTSSTTICITWHRIQGYIIEFLLCVASLVMILRLLAIDPHSRATRIVLFTLFAVECCCMIVIAIIAYHSVYALPLHAGLLCIPAGIPRYSWVWFVPTLVLKTVLFALALYNSIRFLQANLWSKRTITHVLLRDSIIYFTLSEIYIIGNLGSTLYVRTNSTPTEAMFQSPWLHMSYVVTSAATCIMMSRLILNLQNAFYAPIWANDDDDEATSTIRWQSRSRIMASASDVVLESSLTVNDAVTR